MKRRTMIIFCIVHTVFFSSQCKQASPPDYISKINAIRFAIYTYRKDYGKLPENLRELRPYLDGDYLFFNSDDGEKVFWNYSKEGFSKQGMNSLILIGKISAGGHSSKYVGITKELEFWNTDDS